LLLKRKITPFAKLTSPLLVQSWNI